MGLVSPDLSPILVAVATPRTESWVRFCSSANSEIQILTVYLVIYFFNGTTDHTQGARGVQPKKYNRLYLRVEKELDAHIW